jgi:hypothetical protein
MKDATTYDARVYRTDVYRGREVTTYWVQAASTRRNARCGQRLDG